MTTENVLPVNVFDGNLGKLIDIKYSGEISRFKLLGYDLSAGLLTVESTTEEVDLMVIPFTSIVSVRVD